jgi:hypothetical protein
VERNVTQARELTTAAVLDLFRPIHTKIREAIEGLEPASLSWRPGSETNAIGALIHHIVATERGNVARIMEAPSAPFAWDENQTFDRAELLKLLDGADAFLDQASATVPADALSKTVVHPHRGPSTALVLLLQTYGHVYEHFGHLELTRQLYLQSDSGKP